MHKISFAIIAMPERKPFVNSMLERMGDTPVRVFWDIEKKGSWFNARRGWMDKHPDATHQVLMQDDLMICPDFTATVEKIVALLPQEIISLYTPRSEAIPIQESGDHWITRNAVTGQALLMPASLVSEFLIWDAKWNVEFWDPRNTGASQGDDLRISVFMKAHDRFAWYPVPSLVQHVQIKSTLGGVPGRVSNVFKGSDTSILDLDWEKGINNPVKKSYTFYDAELKIFKGKISYV